MAVSIAEQISNLVSDISAAYCDCSFRNSYPNVNSHIFI